MARPEIERVIPGPGQESVWDYPRPPCVELTTRHIEVFAGGALLAETRRAQRLLETSHPPTYYLPRADIDMTRLIASPRQSFCEWKGVASYFHVLVGEALLRDVAWTYEAPTSGFAALASHVAFYAAAMDRCLVDGELVRPQPGGFYGGWVTDDVVGPFKGSPGTMGW